MVKRTIREEVTEYDRDGNIVRRIVTDTSEDDDTQYSPCYPGFMPGSAPMWWTYGPTCQCSTESVGE